MKEGDAYAELSSIRTMMERSSKFISLSGWSGILSGVYALIGAGWAQYLLQHPSGLDTSVTYFNIPVRVVHVALIALTILIFSILTSYWFSRRKAQSRNEHIWNPVSRRLLMAVCVPMLSGGFFTMILLINGDYSIIAAGCLTFYGLALVAGSAYTYDAIRWLGFSEIILGLVALLIPEHGLILWAIGFGLFHILYGSIMYYKYER